MTFIVDQWMRSGATYSAFESVAAAMTHAPAHCSICQKRLGRSIHFLDETGDVPEPKLSWALCDACNTAVREQMAQSPVRGALRLRVAVALVSTDRTPAARRARIGQLSDQHWESLLFWAFLLFMLGHLAVIVFIASIIK